MLAVAVAAIDDEIHEAIEGQRDRLAGYREARRVLKRAADARQPGDHSPAGGVADDRPPAPDLSDTMLALVDHTDGAQAAMRQMLRGPGNVFRGGLERLSPDDLDLLVANLHDLMQVVGVLVIDVTAREDENTNEDRMTLARPGRTR